MKLGDVKSSGSMLSVSDGWEHFLSVIPFQICWRKILIEPDNLQFLIVHDASDGSWGASVKRDGKVTLLEDKFENVEAGKALFGRFKQ
jgi:hypothetical protein